MIVTIGHEMLQNKERPSRLSLQVYGGPSLSHPRLA